MKLIQIVCIFWATIYIYMMMKVSFSYNDIYPKPTAIRWLLTISNSIIFFVACKTNNYLANMKSIVLATIIGANLNICNYCFMASLLTFFFTSSKATKFKTKQKSRFEENIGPVIQRGIINVVCNGGVAILVSLFYIMETGFREMAIDFNDHYNTSWLITSFLGAVCCANGDTWASELGTVLGSDNPYLITSLKRVPKGTNGGVSLIGLLLSALGGLTCSLTFYITLVFTADISSPQFAPLLIVGLFGGLFGSVVDSILGATLQFSGLNIKTNKIVENKGLDVKHINGIEILDNHCVNFLSTLITALVTPYFASNLWPYFQNV